MTVKAADLQRALTLEAFVSSLDKTALAQELLT